ncbi:3-deoxy-D-manno-octulosonic acid transferase [Cellulophaga baltica NN016038]|uniref:3-deoxy-D-manno-octulosonic acid transferase n=1 Tax=Cellulophaga baltica TaxID=76594 RepID=UPI000472F6CB|nr:glycosyltransferase N-terminal domain-containing protein [Cellulophaga baltica]AIY13046.1 3-deoxy-D-manno-octulosonic acid transferase [Cellulophaga baltica NN016038]
MHFIYNCSVYIAGFFLRVLRLFIPKLKLFVNGRKDVFNILKNELSRETPVIWIHTASLGEFEQGLPVIEALKKHYTEYQILVTFFSPSGYEVKKNSSAADLITYLPLDTKHNAAAFIATVNPVLSIFVKYEIWPNYLKELEKRKIPTLLVSAIFSKRQIFFKGYGSFMRKSLSAFSHFFVQDQNSKDLLASIGLKNSTISGDTRFDRVLKILEQDNTLDFMEKFKQDQQCFIAGSSWPEDEAIIVDYINTTNANLKFVFAPHTIKKEAIQKLANAIKKKTILYSELADNNPSDYEVLIIDTIGILTKAYSYADIAYVGGGFATGLHNTLEPAVFGIPVLIGPKYSGFKEAEDLVDLKGVIAISDQKSFTLALDQLVSSQKYYKETGEINTRYIAKRKGATGSIMDYIKTLH